MPEEIMHLLTKEYSIILATTQKEIEAVKEIRNDVLFHRYAIYPELKESKWYLYSQDDKQSFNYLLQHNSTGKYVGTVRMFFVNGHTPSQKTPMQKDSHIENIEHLTQNLPICEISRFALSTDLLKYKDFSELQLRTYLSLALMIATRINAFLYHYSTLFSIMEPSLHRLLKRQSANFEQIGDFVDYYGRRAPFAIERKKLLQETEENVGWVTRYYLKELCQNPEKFWQFIDNNPYLERSDIQLDRIYKLFQEHGDDVDLSLLLEDQKLDATA